MEDSTGSKTFILLPASLCRSYQNGVQYSTAGLQRGLVCFVSVTFVNLTQPDVAKKDLK